MGSRKPERGQHAGRVIIGANLNVREHEIRTAQTLAKNGYVVEFIPESTEKRATSPDILIDGLRWEIKSPTASTSKALERNLRKALRQSENVILDSRRMKLMPAYVVLREITKLRGSVRGIKKLLLIDKSGNLIDIT